MAAAARRPCDFVRPDGSACKNLLRTYVTYREPDQEGRLRRTIVARRCHWHAWDLKWFPEGSSQLVQHGRTAPIVQSPVLPHGVS